MINYVFIPVNPLLISNGGVGIDPISGLIVILFMIWFISKMVKND